MKTLILTGRPAPGAARPDELDTRVQADMIRRVLEDDGHRVVELSLGLDLEEARAVLLHERPGLVFNLVEAIDGRGDLIHLAPALLDSLQMPYTGCPQAAMFLTSNKLQAKGVMALAGIPTPGCWPPDRGERPDAWIVKSVWEHASLGLDAGSIAAADRVGDRLAERASRLGGEWFAEAFVPGREFNLALLEVAGGVTLLPPAEIRFDDFPPGRPRIVDYAAKWDETSFEYHHTPRRFRFGADDAALIGELERIARRCWDVFGLRGYARVDFRVDTAGRPRVLEVNANPCLAPDAGFLAAAERGGYDTRRVIRCIAAAALPVTGGVVACS